MKRALGLDHLHHTVFHVREVSAQHRMPANDLGECFLQRLAVDHALESHADRYVVSGTHLRQLVEKPQPLLRERCYTSRLLARASGWIVSGPEVVFTPLHDLRKQLSS